VAANASAPTLTVNVSVPANSPVSVTNQAAVYGGGDPVHTSSSPTLSNVDSASVVQTPASITINGGATQSANTLAAFATPLAVTIKDAGGVAIANYSSVTFTAPASGASGTFSNVTNTITESTNASGVANAGTFTATSTAGGPYSVTVTAGLAPSVSFSLTNTASTVNVTIATSPSGLLVSGGGAASAAPLVEAWAANSSQTISTSSPQAGAAGVRYVFSGWSDAGAISHGITVPATATTYTATFNTQYQLNVAAGTGAASVTPPSGSYFASGTPVAISATAASGYHFVNWTGSADVASATSASTTIAMNGPENITANFASNPTAPVAAISPTNIDFGTLYLGSVVTKTVTVKNTGNAAMTISDPRIAIVHGGNSNEYVTVNLCPRSLAAGKSCTMTVTFAAGPYYTAPQTATLMINDNAAGSPQSVTLTATVINPQASFNPGSLSFGNQTKNTSVTKTVTLKNTGATTLSNIAMSVTGKNTAQFTLTPASTCGSSLNSGSTCTISVTFKPVARVAYSATLQVTDNTQSGKQTVPLSGTGH
jgi:hypothetical protein